MSVLKEKLSEQHAFWLNENSKLKEELAAAKGEAAPVAGDTEVMSPEGVPIPGGGLDLL